MELLLKLALFLRLPIKKIIKNTIFSQFCGGEFINDCEDNIRNLAKYKVKTILDYSVEGQVNESDFNNVTNEIINTIERAKGENNIPFAVFKVSGLGRFNLLKVSANLNLDEVEIAEYKQIKERVRKFVKSP